MKLWRYGVPLERLGGRYQLEGVLGSGGMADVCLAWDERYSCEVAVKVIKDNELDQRTVDRFLKEASQVARWRHPHILRIFGSTQMQVVDRTNGSMVPYIVMEFAQNGDLHKRLRPGSPFAFAETLIVFEQLCRAVSYAHSQGMIYRDLKPLNILFRALPDGSEQAALNDFGLAVEKDATHFTFAAGGTLPYMAPEQLRGRVEQASDIFALVVILYQLCTGRLPFRRSIIDLRRQDPLPPPRLPSTLFPMLPPDLDALILQALAEDPRQRYADALDFWDEVQEVVSASTIHALSRYQLRYASAHWPSHGPLSSPDRIPTTATAMPSQPPLPRLWRISLTITALLLLGLLSFLVAPMVINGVHAITGNHLNTTITLIPNTHSITENYTIKGVASNPDLQKLQFTIHTLTADKSQTQAVLRSGHTQTQGAVAKGMLTFSNGAFISQTIQAKTEIISQDGTKRVTDTMSTISAANNVTATASDIAVPAHAVNPGTKGNIAIKSVNQTCCTNNNTIFVRNLSPFTGGAGCSGLCVCTTT